MKTTRIIIAGSHEVTRLGIKSILAGTGLYEVCAEAEDGRAAAEMVCHLCPDLLIMDVGLPKLNGFDVARRVKDEAPLTSVLMLADLGSEHLVCEALHAGVKGIILKSESASSLLSSIESVLRGMICISQKVNQTSLDRPQKHSGTELLTLRQREVVQLLAEGHCAEQIAQMLSTSSKTVNTHRSRIYRKLQIHNSAQLIMYAVRHHIVHVDCLRHDSPALSQFPDCGPSANNRGVSMVRDRILMKEKNERDASDRRHRKAVGQRERKLLPTPPTMQPSSINPSVL